MSREPVDKFLIHAIGLRILELVKRCERSAIANSTFSGKYLGENFASSLPQSDTAILLIVGILN